MLCALTHQGQLAFQDELSELRAHGHQVIVEESPERAMAQVVSRRPSVIVLGTSLGAMEWFEFTARLARDHADLDARVIVMPDKEDPFPAVINSRDPSTGVFTGHYLAPGLHLDAIVEALAAMADASTGASLSGLASGSGPIDLEELAEEGNDPTGETDSRPSGPRNATRGPHDSH